MIIPKSIISIGEQAFGMDIMFGDSNPYLHYIKYLGSNNDIINNTNKWYTSYVKELIITNEIINN